MLRLPVEGGRLECDAPVRHHVLGSGIQTISYVIHITRNNMANKSLGLDYYQLKSLKLICKPILFINMTRHPEKEKYMAYGHLYA